MGDYNYFKEEWDAVLNAMKDDANLTSIVPVTEIYDNDLILQDHKNRSKPAISCPMERKLPGTLPTSGDREYLWRFPITIYTQYLTPDASKDQLLQIMGGITQIFENPKNQWLGGAVTLRITDLQMSLGVDIKSSKSVSRIARLLLVGTYYIPNPV